LVTRYKTVFVDKTTAQSLLGTFNLTAEKLEAIQQRFSPRINPFTKKLPALDMSLPRLRPWTVEPMSTMHSPPVYHVTCYFWMELRGNSALVINKSLMWENITPR
tara:strand:- start:21 stop:335 length:315 start_codon:yes stop_codon:yes gene_type:complete